MTHIGHLQGFGAHRNQSPNREIENMCAFSGSLAAAEMRDIVSIGVAIIYLLVLVVSIWDIMAAVRFE